MGDGQQHVGSVKRVVTAEAARQARADALAALSLERVLMYGDAWRRFARQWTEQSKACDDPERAKRLRHLAQAALHAAHEADELFKTRERADFTAA